ncbi:MAG: sodium-dependent transporter [Ruminococcaceae bacterium]|nr:sodium-dependent transporter [Oscillospiraceae bacterium]
MARERLGSRLGFILLSAGCAIGIGNVWKFPYMVGQNGGAIFVLIYLFFLAIFGLPIMTMEFSLGRASQKSPVHIYKPLAPKKSGWHIHGYAAMIGCYILMMFYTVVSGWIFRYFVSTAKGDFVGLDAAGVSNQFGDIVAKPWPMVIFSFVVIALGFFICSFDLQKGLERITKYMMVALLVIMVGLAVFAMTLPGAAEGLKFYLVPDVSKVKEAGIISVVSGAMVQALFTLSLGIGSMAIFGSYLDDKRSLMGEAVNVAVLDTFVAFTSGLIIFPACFAYNGGETQSGPPLIFEVLPNIFNHMPGGRILGTLFFLFLCFAAFSTVLAVFQAIIACCEDVFKWSKKKACLINGIIMPILALPCILGFNEWSGFKPFGDGTNVLDLEDYIVSYVLLPLGSLVFVLFCSHKFGWGWDNFVNEANKGKGLKVKPWLKPYCQYILPIIAIIVFICGQLSFFGVIK